MGHQSDEAIQVAMDLKYGEPVVIEESSPRFIFPLHREDDYCIDSSTGIKVKKKDLYGPPYISGEERSHTVRDWSSWKSGPNGLQWKLYSLD